MITKKEVIDLITKKIPSSKVLVENIKGNDHLQVTVIASEFNGLSLIKQHQLVYSALKEELASEAIHALALKTETPTHTMPASMHWDGTMSLLQVEVQSHRKDSTVPNQMPHWYESDPWPPSM